MPLAYRPLGGEAGLIRVKLYHNFVLESQILLNVFDYDEDVEESSFNKTEENINGELISNFFGARQVISFKAVNSLSVPQEGVKSNRMSIQELALYCERVLMYPDLYFMNVYFRGVGSSDEKFIYQAVPTKIPVKKELITTGNIAQSIEFEFKEKGLLSTFGFGLDNDIMDEDDDIIVTEESTDEDIEILATEDEESLSQEPTWSTTP